MHILLKFYFLKEEENDRGIYMEKWQVYAVTGKFVKEKILAQLWQ